MKKFLTSIFACLFVVISIFTISGCEKKRDYNGIYKLSFACYLNDNKIETYSLDTNTTYETYIKIEGQKVTEYVFKYSVNDTKDLISLTVPSTVLPEFYITKEGDTEYFTNFTNLNRYIEGTNQNKIERWTYIKVDSLPNIAQNELVQYFGNYELEQEWRSGQQVANPTKVKLEVNGNIKFTTGEGDSAVKTEYTYGGTNNGIYMFFNSDVTMNLVITGEKIKTFLSSGNADRDYSIYSRIVEE